MVANCDRNCAGLRRMLVAASALAIGISFSAAAQTSVAANNSSDGQSYSSSALPTTEALLGSMPAAPSASAAVASPSPQYGGSKNNYPSYPNYQSRTSHIAFVGGAGLTSPVGNTTHSYETYGYNFDVGGGWMFTKKFGALFEYGFNKNKIPGATIASVGAQGGNINTHLFMANAIYYPYAHGSKGIYVTAGPGYSRKVTNFTDLEPTEECYYFCYYGYAPVTVDNFSSSQFAFDGGVGFYWKAFGQDSRAKLFAEARYVFVDSPAATKTTNGEGTEGIIPATFGIRF
jgi:hypothetical protein